MDTSTFVQMFFGAAPTRILLPSLCKYISVIDTTWQAVKAKATGYLSDAGYISVVAGLSSQNYYFIRRQLVEFDASLITNAVTSAKLRIVKNSDWSSNVAVYNCSKPPPQVVTDDDFDSLGTFFGSETEIIEIEGQAYWLVTLNSDALNLINDRNKPNYSVRFVIIDYENDYLNIAPMTGNQAALVSSDCRLLLTY